MTLELFDLCSVAVAEPRSRLSSLRESPRLSLGPLHAVDASNNRRHKASESSVWRAVFGKGAIEKNKKKREKRKQRHEAERTRMAVVYNCFAHLESIARFPRPVGSCVFVLLARCRARLAWTYPYDSAITRDILPPNTPSTQALEVMNCYAEEAPDRFPTSACRRGCCFSWPFDALISTQARGGAQARARRRRRVVALRARRHGPRAAHVGGPGAFPASFLFLCLRPCGVALATRTWGGYGAVVEAAVRRYIQMKCLALLDGPFVVGHKGRVGGGKRATIEP